MTDIKTNFDSKIFIIDNILNQTECDDLIDYYNKVGPTHQWNLTYPMTINLSDKFLRKNILKIEDTINFFLSKKLSVDWCEIVKWPVGSFQEEHFDFSSENTVFTSITYLNNNYEGGETYFVDDVKIVPKVGRTVFFNGNYYKHGVTKVQKDIRYTVPIWYKK